MSGTPSTIGLSDSIKSPICPVCGHHVGPRWYKDHVAKCMKNERVIEDTANLTTKQANIGERVAGIGTVVKAPKPDAEPQVDAFETMKRSIIDSRLAGNAPAGGKDALPGDGQESGISTEKKDVDDVEAVIKEAQGDGNTEKVAPIVPAGAQDRDDWPPSDVTNGVAGTGKAASVLYAGDGFDIETDALMAIVQEIIDKKIRISDINIYSSENMQGTVRHVQFNAIDYKPRPPSDDGVYGR